MASFPGQKGTGPPLTTPVIITPSPLPGTAVNVFYSVTLSANLGTPPYTWTLQSILPDADNLTLSSSGVLSGTPTTVENLSLVIVATDSVGTPSAPTNFSLTVAAVLPPRQMFSGYQDTQSVAITWWGPTTQTAFHTGNPDYYHVYENVGGVWTISPGQLGNSALTNPGVTPSSGIAPNTHNPCPGYVRRGLAAGTTTLFSVRSVLGGLESANGPVLTMTTLANGVSTPPTPPADTSWEQGIQLAGTPVVCNSQATFLAALSAANPAGPNVIALDPTGTYAIPNTNGYIIQTSAGIFTGTSGWTTIISTEAPEYKAFTGLTGGKLPAFNATAGPPYWQVVNCTAVIPVNATSASLSVPWALKSGWYYVWFQEGTGTAAVIEERWVVFTQGQTTIDWHLNNGNYPSAGLTAQATATLRVFYEPSVTPWDAFTNIAMPTIDMGATVNCFGIEIPAGTTKVRFIGINIKTTGVGAASSTTQATGYIHFANSQEPSLGGAVTPAESVYFDRCMWGNDTGSATYQYCAHGLGWVNCNHLLVSQCYGYGVATNFIPSGGDSNNFTLNGRNHLWRSTYLSAVAECHIVGGLYFDNVNPPSDIHYLNLSTHKPLGWLQGVSVAIASYTPGPGSVGATGGTLAAPWGFASGTCNVVLSAESSTATFTNGSTTFTFGTALTKTDTLLMNPQGFAAFGNGGGLVPYWQFGREVKNHLEQKTTSRSTYTGIISRNCWVGKIPGYHGTAFAINARDQQMSDNAAVNDTDCCPYAQSLDADLQNNITLNCPSALVVFSSDFSTGAYTARVRYKNGLSWISTYSVGEQMAAVWMIGPVSDLIIDQCTFLTNQQVSTVGFGGALGVHFSWFNPLQGTNANMTPFSPFPYTAFQDRLTITNSIIDSSVSAQPPNPAFFQDAVITTNFASYPNITFNKNVTINDTSTGYPNLAATNIAYANVGFQNYQSNNLPPLNVSDWNVVNAGTANLNTASTTGGAVGATFSTSLQITTSTLAATVGTALSQPLVAQGGTAPYLWNIESAAPARHLWPFLSSSGTLSGTPQCDNLGQFNQPDIITVRCTDSAGTSVVGSVTVNLTASGPLAIVSPATLPAAAQNGDYHYQLIAQGGAPPYIYWSITSHTGSNTWTLSNNGWLYGVPTAQTVDTVTVQCKDCAGNTASQTFSITTNTTIQLAQQDFLNNVVNLPDAEVGVGYQHQLKPAHGGTGTGQAFSIVSGTLPAGLSMSAAGLITGTPTKFGNANCSLQCVDSGPNTSVAVPIALNVSSRTTGSRPAGNTSKTNFFVDTTGHFCDPLGIRFQYRGFDRTHFDSNGTGLGTLTGASAVRYGMFKTQFRGANPSGSNTLATYASRATTDHINNNQLVILTNFYSPGDTFTNAVNAGIGTDMTGEVDPVKFGIIAAWWCDNVAAYESSGLHDRSIINIQNEWGPLNQNMQFCAAAAWDGPVQTGIWQMPITSANSTTGVITLSSTNAAHPLANCAQIGWIFIAGGNLNVAVQISTTTGGSSGAWTVTATTPSVLAPYTSGGTVSGGAIGMLRAAGFTEPLLIDMGQYAQSMAAMAQFFVPIGQSDPFQNCILAEHSYGFTCNYVARITSIPGVANATIALNSTDTHYPFYVSGLGPQPTTNTNITKMFVTGTSLASINNTAFSCNVNGSPPGGVGSSGAWTFPTQTTTPAASTGGICAPDFNSQTHNIDRLTSWMRNTVSQSGITCTITEYSLGKEQDAFSSANIEPQEIIQSCEANGIGHCYWSFDGGAPWNAALSNGVYALPTDLTTQGINILLNPRYGVHALASPAPSFTQTPIARLEGNWTESTASSTGSIQMSIATTIGQPIFVALEASTTSTISDNQGNTYTLIDSWNSPGGNMFLFMALAKTTVAPLVTKIDPGGPPSWKMQVETFTGFQGTPTKDTSFAKTQWTSTGTATPSFSPITSNFNKEILFMPYKCSVVPTAIPPNWSDMGAPINGQTFVGDSWFAICASAGTNKNFLANLPSAQTYYSLLVGVYDAF